MDINGMKRNTEHLEMQFWPQTIICHPELEDSCPWEKLGPTAWHDILLEHPECIRHAPKKITQSFMTVNQWLEVLIRHPELEPYLPTGRTFLGKDSAVIGKLWGELLARHPQFAKFHPWKHLRNTDWVCVLSQQPQFIDNYDNDRGEKPAWSHTLGSSDMAAIIACQPGLFEHFSANDFPGHAWQTILFNQPQFCDRCPFHKIEPQSLGTILARYPQYLPRCSPYSLDPKSILVVAEEFPEILNHTDLEKFREIGGKDTPWIEKYPALVPYTSWRFSYAYWDALLTRLSNWLETGRRTAVSVWGDGWCGRHPSSVTPPTWRKRNGTLELKRPRPPEPNRRNLRNSVDSIMDFLYWHGQDIAIEQVGAIPMNIRNILNDNDLTYEQLMLKMSMMSEEDCGMLFFGAFLQNRPDVLDPMFDNDNLDQTIRQIPPQYLLPVAVLFFSSGLLEYMLLRIEDIYRGAVASFKDSAGNNVLHYAFFRAPWHPEEQEDKQEAGLFATLREFYGVSADAPNAMGFTYRQLTQGMEDYLAGK